MAGKTPHEAVRNFIDPLQQALSCVTQDILLVRGGYFPSDTPHPLTLGNNPTNSVLLGRDRRLALKMIQHYKLVEDTPPRGPWKVQIVAYYYTVEEMSTSARELFAYHWHPNERTAITFPHLHFYHGAGTLRDDIRKAHFPTGRIALEEVLRLVITQFDVQPLRENWNDILNTTQRAFEDWRTWP